jgi:CRISPR-associated protein Csm1
LGEDQNGEIKSKFVLSLEVLGRLLPEATHIAYVPIDRQNQKAEIATSWHDALRVFGLNVWIRPDDKDQPIKAVEGEFLRIWQLKPTPSQSDKQWNAETTWIKSLKECVVSYRPFAKLTPFNEVGEIKTTDELAQPTQGGFERWGVLRLDVDNLGEMFKKGFGDKASLARSSGLSFAMRLFFEGWLPELATSFEDGDGDLSPHLYIQYAGGDDVFVIGAWDVLPRFARRIRRSFGEYVVGNPALTLSGGVALADAGFPLYQAAQQADDAEYAAKDFKRTGGKGKDALTFLNVTLDWDELGQTEKRAYFLAEAVSSKGLPHSTLQTILSLTGQALRSKKFMFGPWTWMAAYQLTRIKNKAKGESQHYIEEVQQEFLKPTDRNKFKSIALAARWAQYLSRGE